MALSKSSDARLLAVCAPDGRVQIWDWLEGKLERKLGPRSSPARSATFSPDGQYVAVNKSGSRGRIAVWRTADGRSAAEFSEPTSEYWPCNIAWSPDQYTLATLGRRDHVVRLWDVRPRSIFPGQYYEDEDTRRDSAGFAVGPLSVALSLAITSYDNSRAASSVYAKAVIKISNLSSTPVDVEFECSFQSSLLAFDPNLTWPRHVQAVPRTAPETPFIIQLNAYRAKERMIGTEALTLRWLSYRYNGSSAWGARHFPPTGNTATILVR
jgi:WD40 repeat protein